ncbi:MAG: hypothetical protein NXI14_05960 [bacterium]|nr:hypothetical protein [bacterium]
MTDLTTRLRRLEHSLQTASHERLNRLRVEFSFAVLEMDLVMRRWDSLNCESPEAADEAIEDAVFRAFPDGQGVVFHGLNETERVQVSGDGIDFDEMVEALKRSNRELHWTDEARAAVAAAHCLPKSPNESD